MILLTSGLVTSAGCADESKVIEPLLLRLNTQNSTEMRVDSVLGLSPNAYVCFLEPYVSQVNSGNKNNSNINAHLRKINFRGVEHSWAIVYGTADDWKVEYIKASIFGAYQFKNELGSRIDSRCGHANSVYLFRSSQNSINFNFMEKI